MRIKIMCRNELSRRILPAGLLMFAVTVGFAAVPADRFDSVLAHVSRSPADLKRDLADHSVEILRLTGIKPGMQVADILAGDGYFSELLSYLVGPKGHVDLINNSAFDKWSGIDLTSRLANGRLANVEHRTLDLNHMGLKAGSLDAVLLIKVYHDLYWLDPEGVWPKVDTASVLEQIAHALNRDGVLLLVDHAAKSGHGSTDASTLHRIDEDFAIKDFESHGFKMIAKSDLLRRPDDPREQISYKAPMLGKTDRFVLVFKKGAPGN